MITEEIKSKIEAAYDEGFYAFGVRAMTNNVEVLEGDEIENSYHWEDGESTGEEIDGTCAVGFIVDFGEIDDEEKVAKIIESVKATYAGNGEQVVIVAGHQNIDEATNDQGEIIIKDAFVVAAL